MENVYFFTGFPAFIASRLVECLIKQHDASHIYLLVQPSFVTKAELEVRRLVANSTTSFHQYTIIPGDITKPHLNMPHHIQQEITQQITHVFHLAAVYDLAVPENIAYEINVNGTKHVNQFVSTLPHLQRYTYFSTAYVSGTREGTILETELEMNQRFKNHYESTKFQAEKLVQSISIDSPTTIIRPGIVRGDSQTGETIKFDGIYFLLNLFDKIRSFPIIPYLGRGDAQGNFVPVDYILQATLYLSHVDNGIGKTYHLTDPNPYTMKEIYEMMMQEYLNRRPTGVLPLALAKTGLSLSTVRKWLRVEKEALDYFTCKAEYDCTQATEDLKGSNIRCPDFKKTIASMLPFYEQYKHDPTKHLTIQ
ncbi:SDR family oxidoreductase [Priestia koreensis]|uniref:SDR family oxidoreductase n=1 Tax=Priestia koreensis TaxID=284581 RepID=UPI003CFF5663